MLAFACGCWGREGGSCACVGNGGGGGEGFVRPMDRNGKLGAVRRCCGQPAPAPSPSPPATSHRSHATPCPPPSLPVCRCGGAGGASATTAAVTSTCDGTCVLPVGLRPTRWGWGTWLPGTLRLSAVGTGVVESETAPAVCPASHPTSVVAGRRTPQTRTLPRAATVTARCVGGGGGGGGGRGATSTHAHFHPRIQHPHCRV
jgi:hypothetical protein